MGFDIFFNQKLADKNSEIMNAYFTLNKKLDNFMDYLDINLCMNNLSQKIHTIAHKAPLDADRFRDYNALYSFRTKYDTIAGQYEDYTDIFAGIKNIIDYTLDMTYMLYDAKQLGEDEENFDYVKFIEDEIDKIRFYKKIFILLYDKTEKALQEKNTLQDIDFMTESFLNDI